MSRGSKRLGGTPRPTGNPPDGGAFLEFLTRRGKEPLERYFFGA